MPNLRSIDVDLHLATNVIDQTIYDDNTLLEKPSMVIEKEFESGVLNSDPIINTISLETKEEGAKSNTLVSTLAAPTHENHVPLNMDQTQLTPTTEEGGITEKYSGLGSMLCANLALMKLEC